MMKRLYYLTKRIECAEKISNELHRKGVTDWNFHIISKNKENLDQHHLHKASYFFHERDGYRMAERGAIIGIIAGLCAIIGLLMATPEMAAAYRVYSVVTLGFVSLILVAFGVGFGAIYGLDYENIKIKRFHSQLEVGEYLLMIDLKKEDAPEIKTLLSSFQDVIEAGEDQTFVNPFELAT